MPINDFISNATLRLCSSLNLQEAIDATFDYLKLHIPLDELFVDIFDFKEHTLNRIAVVSQDKQSTDIKQVKLSDKLKLTEIFPNLDSIFILNNAEDLFNLPIGKEFLDLVGTHGKSEIVMNVRSKTDSAGFIILRAYGENRYTENHINMIGKLRDAFILAVGNALAHNKLAEENINIQRHYLSLSENIIGSAESDIAGSTGIKKVLTQADKVVNLDNTVLITGETGVGKEVIASYIYNNSPLKSAPFVKVNCGSIPENLIDSELFGYEKGAFTGAQSRHIGKFERADGGILFLDEIGELPMEVQARLLRFLQFKEIERLGGKSPIRLNVRIIAATNRDLEQMVKDGSFREDLWYRLSVFPIDIPPLRKRKEDIPYLIEYLLERKCTKLGIKNKPAISNSMMKKLVDYDWPGNVREMQNVMERELILNHDKELKFSCIQVVETQQSGADSEFICLSDDITLDGVVKSHISNILKKTNGRISGKNGAATILGLHPNTLRNKMIKLGLM